jgi:hypothetical protein
VETARCTVIPHEVALLKKRSRRVDDIGALLYETGVISLVVSADVV